MHVLGEQPIIDLYMHSGILSELSTHVAKHPSSISNWKIGCHVSAPLVNTYIQLSNKTEECTWWLNVRLISVGKQYPPPQTPPLQILEGRGLRTRLGGRWTYIVPCINLMAGTWVRAVLNSLLSERFSVSEWWVIPWAASSLRVYVLQVSLCGPFLGGRSVCPPVKLLSM